MDDIFYTLPLFVLSSILFIKHQQDFFFLSLLTIAYFYFAFSFTNSFTLQILSISLKKIVEMIRETRYFLLLLFYRIEVLLRFMKYTAFQNVWIFFLSKKKKV